MITKVLIGWYSKTTTIDFLFGTILDKLLQKTGKMVLVAKLIRAIELIGKIYIFLPDKVEHEMGFYELVSMLNNLTRNLNKPVVVFGKSHSYNALKNVLSSKKHKVNHVFHDAEINTRLFYTLKEEAITDNDLIILIKARKNSLSHSKTVDSYPKLTKRLFHENSIIMVYPEQLGYKAGFFRLYNYN